MNKTTAISNFVLIECCAKYHIDNERITYITM